MNIIINGHQGDGKTQAAKAIAQIVRRKENEEPNSVLNHIGAPDVHLIRHELIHTSPDVVVFDGLISFKEIRDVVEVVDKYRDSYVCPELVLIIVTNMPI